LLPPIRERFSRDKVIQDKVVLLSHTASEEEFSDHKSDQKDHENLVNKSKIEAQELLET